ncbi:MAG: hypothetical protein HYY84_05935 [Deltaproteobacteria bacterium]|nr:hypothetical protein [Deltaproteobacteria bacterium]
MTDIETTPDVPSRASTVPAPLPLWTNSLRYFLWFAYLGVAVAVSFVFHEAPWLRLTLACGAWVGIVTILLFMVLYSRVDLHESHPSAGAHLLNWLVFIPAAVAIPILLDGRAFDALTGALTLGLTSLFLLGVWPKLFRVVAAKEASTFGRVGPALSHAIGYALLYTGWVAFMPLIVEYVLPFVFDD